MIFLIAIVTGVLLFLAFPPFDFSFLIWISLVPAFLYIRHKNLSYTISLIFGFIGYCIGLIFIFSGVIKNYGFLFFLYAIFYNAFLSGGLVFLIYSVNKSKNVFIRLSEVAACFIVIEYFKTLSILSFPGSLALTQYKNFFLLQIVSKTGFYGISLIIILSNLILSELICKIIKKRNAVIYWFLLILVLLVLYLTSIIPLKTISVKSDAIKVSVLQTGLPISCFNVSNKTEIFSLYLEQIQSINSKMLIIPEGLGKIIDENGKIASLKNIASNKNLNILINIDDVNMDYSKKYNSSGLIENTGRLKQFYHKTKPIPLAEIEYYPGCQKQRLLSKDGLKIAVNICFESLYPEISRLQMIKGGNLLVIQANDAGFEGNIIPELHKRYAVFRAVENGVFTIHASQAGPSAFITPNGLIFSESRLFEKSNLTEYIHLTTNNTFYNQFGDLLVYLSMMITIICIIYMLSIKFVGLGTSVNKA